jgi:hypothetical protein
VVCGLGIDRGPYEEEFEVFHPTTNTTKDEELPLDSSTSLVNRSLAYVLICLCVILIVVFASNLYLLGHMAKALLFSQRRHLQRSIANQVSWSTSESPNKRSIVLSREGCDLLTAAPPAALHGQLGELKHI